MPFFSFLCQYFLYFFMNCLSFSKPLFFLTPSICKNFRYVEHLIHDWQPWDSISTKYQIRRWSEISTHLMNLRFQINNNRSKTMKLSKENMPSKSVKLSPFGNLRYNQSLVSRLLDNTVTSSVGLLKHFSNNNNFN